MKEKPQLEQIAYSDAASDFAPLAETPGAFFLDSSLHHQTNGRFSFWGAYPIFDYSFKEGFVNFHGKTQISTPIDSLQLLYSKIADMPVDPYLPFSCGLVGFLSYEWGASLENVPPFERDDLLLPEARFGFYDTVVIYDHLEESCKIVSYGLNQDLQVNHSLGEKKIAHLKKKIVTQRKNNPVSFETQGQTPGKTLSSMNDAEYSMAFEKIQKYLHAGDCYQINLTKRFSTPLRKTPWAIYSKLRRLSKSLYAAFINAGDFQILSSSPELFLKAGTDGHLQTEPIKGTRKRGATKEEDAELKWELLNSEKDRAELLMITDLERNDLGRVAVPGSVKTTTLEKVLSFDQVHHLHSVIEAKRDPRYNIVDVLKAMMPGGSITGAPKIRAMEIIRELEKNRRDIYTGAIGWIGPQNSCQMNVAIRTMVIKDNRAHCYAGGGITVDSNCAAEQEELLVKASGMFNSLDL